MWMTENLGGKYIVGYGASSTVYKCVLKSFRPVAIKRLYSHFPQSIKDLESICSIKHQNLVSFQGYLLSPSRNLLFYDYMENGSLWVFIHEAGLAHKTQNSTIVVPQSIKELETICSVKHQNLILKLISQNLILLRACVHPSCPPQLIMGNIGYIDPEYARTSRLTEKFDVWIVLELLSEKTCRTSPIFITWYDYLFRRTTPKGCLPLFLLAANGAGCVLQRYTNKEKNKLQNKDI